MDLVHGGSPGSYAIVQTIMRIQMVQLDECLSTTGALERTFTGVHPFVNVEIAQLGECLSTLLAFVRSFPGVRPFVPNQF